LSTAGRVLGIDLGSKRIGVAVSDPGGILATPHSVIQRGASVELDHAAIAAVVREVEAERVVVGLPVSMSGKNGPAARAAQQEADGLAGVLLVPVETWDERLTTVVASRAMIGAGRKAADRRRNVDAVAASVILQSWLDAR
jgi:putative Holliday junction resolvase